MNTGETLFVHCCRRFIILIMVVMKCSMRSIHQLPALSLKRCRLRAAFINRPKNGCCPFEKNATIQVHCWYSMRYRLALEEQELYGHSGSLILSLIFCYWVKRSAAGCRSALLSRRKV